jgi:hypothetical protein
MRRILVLISERPGGTSANLFDELVRVIEPHCSVRVVQHHSARQSGAALALALLVNNVRSAFAVFWSQTIVLHVFLAGWAPTVVLARLLRRKVVVFQWDIYPASLAGRPLPASWLRRCANWIENWMLRQASVLVIPTDDFRPFVRLQSVGGVIPLWPQQSLKMVQNQAFKAENGVVRIGFAGQISSTRGIAACLEMLQQVSVAAVEVHLYSGSPMPDVSKLDHNKVRVTHHGHLQRERLQDELRQMHFGLISLSPDLDQPGYPSKTYDYLAAGLPILYFGRPLPAFTFALAEAGLGVVLSGQEPVDLAKTYSELSADFDNKRQAYLARCALRWSALADIL